MRSYARHQLKQDAFTTSTAETISWAMDNRSRVIAVGIVLAVIAAVIGGGWAYISYRDQQAKTVLAQALQIYQSPIRPEGTPATPGVPSYGSTEERDKAANAEFDRIANKYKFTQSSQIARYFAGVTYRDLGNNAAAETNLKEVAASRYPQFASLAKMALAGICHDTSRNIDAIDLYKNLIDHPTNSVGKTTAQFALASLYESMTRPDDARHIYEQMQKESPASGVAQLAGERLQALNRAE